MCEKNRLLVVGSLNYDLILEQIRLPKKGETLTVKKITTGGGGKGGNQAVQSAKLGCETVMVGAVGHDFYGDYLKQHLLQRGVDTTFVKQVDEPTGLGINNVLPDGTVYGNIFRGANYSLTHEDLDQAESEFKESRVVLFQMEIPMPVTEYGIELANRHNNYIILNAAPAMPITEKNLRLVDCLIVNENEASFYLGIPIVDIAAAKKHGRGLLKRVRDAVIITLGDQGSLMFTEDSSIYFPARKVKAVDSTGAGDSYVGTFAVKLLKGASLIQAARWATLSASVTVTKPGSQEAMPNLEEIQNLFPAIEPVRLGI